MQGRIFTQVHGRSDHPDFHANRLHETPKIRNDDDGFTNECSIFLNDGQNCGSHPNCGLNQRLQLKLVSGNDGVIQFIPKSSIPGGYNFTYTTTHNGDAAVDKRLFNYLNNKELYPNTFDIYPRLESANSGYKL